jgi:hypothetical protein
MSLEEVIAESIDVPNQDTKNVAAIIADYAKYKILNYMEIKCVCIHIESYNYPRDSFFFVYDGEYYYLLKDFFEIQFINGIPSSIEKPQPEKSIIENPEKYVFVELNYSITAWRLIKKYNTFEEFYKVYKLHIHKWDRLLHIDNREMLDGRTIRMHYMYTAIYDSENEDGERTEFCLNLRDSILRLFDDDDD